EDEGSSFCGRRGGNRCGSSMRNKFGRAEQEGDCRDECGRRAVVYAALLQGRKAASETVWRFRPGRPLDRSGENTWRFGCPCTHAPARRTGHSYRRHVVSGGRREIRRSEAEKLPGGQFYHHSGRRSTLCGNEGRPCCCTAEWSRKISDELPGEVNR